MDRVDTLLISVYGDVLVVGRKRPNQTAEVINAFQGEEAEELYTRLITKKNKGDVIDSNN